MTDATNSAIVSDLHIGQKDLQYWISRMNSIIARVNVQAKHVKILSVPVATRLCMNRSPKQRMNTRNRKSL
jgi:hypothetical protein